MNVTINILAAILTISSFTANAGEIVCDYYEANLSTSYISYSYELRKSRLLKSEDTEEQGLQLYELVTIGRSGEKKGAPMKVDKTEIIANNLQCTFKDDVPLLSACSNFPVDENGDGEYDEPVYGGSLAIKEVSEKSVGQNARGVHVTKRDFLKFEMWPTSHSQSEPKEFSAELKTCRPLKPIAPK